MKIRTAYSGFGCFLVYKTDSTSVLFWEDGNFYIVGCKIYNEVDDVKLSNTVSARWVRSEPRDLNLNT